MSKTRQSGTGGVTLLFAVALGATSVAVPLSGMSAGTAAGAVQRISHVAVHPATDARPASSPYGVPAVARSGLAAVPGILAADFPHHLLSRRGGRTTITVRTADATTCQLTLARDSGVSVSFNHAPVACADGIFQSAIRFGANRRQTRARLVFDFVARNGRAVVSKGMLLLVARRPLVPASASPPLSPTLPSSSNPAPTSTTTPVPPTPTPPTTTLPPSPAFPGASSSNWAGYVLSGRSGGYKAVAAQWTVPTLECANAGGTTADWVGVNGTGSTNPGLFQDGSVESCSGTRESASAWWTDEANGYEMQTLFRVAPGDSLYAQVFQNAAGDWAYYLKDLTTGASSGAVEPFSGPGTSAEWIAEDPGSPGGGLEPLANFGTVTFTNLGLSIPSGSWTDPPYGDAVQMTTADGSLEALPSPVQGSGATASFTVTYEGPPAVGALLLPSGEANGPISSIVPAPAAT